MRENLILFYFVLLNLGVQAQIISDLDLRYFQVTKVQDHVTCKWKTGMDFTCSDVTLYYGLDSNNMKEIYQYPGICGGALEEKEYEFLHRNPVNGYLYYQLRLGTFGNSRILSLENPNPPEHAIYPNPTLDLFQVFVKNYTTYFSVRIYSMTGKEVKSFTEVKNKDFLNIAELKAGLYLYSITLSNKKTFKGKIVKK